MIISANYGRSTLKIFKNAQNDFDFLIRDIDRQPVTTLTGTLLLMVNDDDGNVLATAPITVADANYGHYKANITANSTLTLNKGLYSWCVKYVTTGPTNYLLYTNQDYEVRGIAEVLDGFLQPVDDPYSINGTDFTPDESIFYTSALTGSSPNNYTGNHTLLIYGATFTGNVSVDVSLSVGVPTDPSDWIELDTIELSNYTGTYQYDFGGNYNYVRFRTTSITGLTKIVFRN